MGPPVDILKLAVEESQIHHEPEYHLTNNNLDQDHRSTLSEIWKPYEDDQLVCKSKTTKRYKQFRNLNLYCDKIKLFSPYQFTFEDRVFDVHYADILPFVKDGNILSIVMFLLKLTLGTMFKITIISLKFSKLLLIFF